MTHPSRIPQIGSKGLEKRVKKALHAGYPMPKYVEFCYRMRAAGLETRLHEAITTVSKYVYISEPGGKDYFKVRFSNHRPNKHQQFIGDSDFYVGVANGSVTTTEDAVRATLAKFGKQEPTKFVPPTKETIGNFLTAHRSEKCQKNQQTQSLPSG